MAVIDRPVRFDVRMPPDLAQDMQDLEQQTGLSRGEIFRRAMALYKRAKETQQERGNVILRDSDGTLREVVGF
jgi:metal-responsive CopG/Arc/MetJ family transcriptional regulator